MSFLLNIPYCYNLNNFIIAMIYRLTKPDIADAMIASSSLSLNHLGGRHPENGGINISITNTTGLGDANHYPSIYLVVS